MRSQRERARRHGIDTNLRVMHSRVLAQQSVVASRPAEKYCQLRARHERAVLLTSLEMICTKKCMATVTNVYICIHGRSGRYAYHVTCAQQNVSTDHPTQYRSLASDNNKGEKGVNPCHRWYSCEPMATRRCYAKVKYTSEHDHGWCSCAPMATRTVRAEANDRIYTDVHLWQRDCVPGRMCSLSPSL